MTGRRAKLASRLNAEGAYRKVALPAEDKAPRAELGAGRADGAKR